MSKLFSTLQPERVLPARGGFKALEIARAHAARDLQAVLAVQMARTVARLGFSAMAAVCVGRLIMDQPVSPWSPVLALTFLAAAAVLGFIADRLQAAAETAVTIRLRRAATERLDAMPAAQLQSLPAGGLVVAMQRFPESVSALVISHRAATTMMAIGPLAVALTLALVSWQAAALIVGLTPVIIVFFALVGDAIRRRATAQEQALSRLAAQFADRIRTLPTILANHALAVEQMKLRTRLQAYADKSMSVLGLAFVNAGIIDFFASLSIAILAVFLGLGHLRLAAIPGFSHLALWQSLFILMAAPEYFVPFRRFSEQYHAKAEGCAAAAALDRLLDLAFDAPPSIAALDQLTLRAPERGLVAVVGPSSCGKSTLLRRLAGIDPLVHEDQPSLTEVVWISTASLVPEGTLAQAIGWRLGALPVDRVAAAAAAVGLLDDDLLRGGLSARLAPGGANLSGGQRLRLSVARALLSGRTILADEPTAKLDARSAELVRRALIDMARSRLVVVATHDREVEAAATQVVDLTSAEMLEAAA